MLVEKNSVIVVDKNAVYHDLDHSAAMIQSIYKGHLVRALYNPVIQKQPGEISIKKTLLIPGDSSSYTTIITLYPKYIYINATNDENNLKVLLKNEIMSGYPADFHKKDIIEQHIIPRLHIINKNGKKELHGIKEFEMVINK